MLVPTPIGPGPVYRPPPAMHAACVRGTGLERRVHLELFANGFVVIVPARIGVRNAACRAGTWTSEPTGVVRFDRAATLGDVFSVWGRPLGPTRLLGFRGAVRLYRNGSRLRGDPRRARLHDGDELVLEVGPYVPPHRSYRFPR